MKFTAPAKALHAALAYVAAAIDPRPVEPVLHGVHLDTTSGKLVLTAFNYDLALRATVDQAEIQEPGLAVVPGKVFTAVAAKMHGNVLVAAGHDGPTLKVKGLGEPGQSKRKHPEYDLDTFPVGSYPDLKGWFSHETTATVDGSILALVFAKVQHAASKDDTVPQLSAVQLLAQDNLLYLSTTDRYRIARYLLRYDGAFGEALVPARTLGAILKGMEGQTGIGHDAGVLSFHTARRQAAIRTLDSQFPQIGTLIEKCKPRWATKFSRTDMADALDRIIVIRDNDNAPMDLHIGADQIELRAAGGNQQVGSEWVPCETNVTDAPAGHDLPLQIRVNPAYLLEAMKAQTTERVELGSTDAVKCQPLAINGDASFQSLLMPIRHQS